MIDEVMLERTNSGIYEGSIIAIIKEAIYFERKLNFKLAVEFWDLEAKN